MVLILKLFSIGLESAAVSDAVFFKALDLVANLLPLASPPPPTTSSAPGTATKEKPPPSGAGAVLIPRSALEDVVNQAAVRATRPPRWPRTEAEEERIKEAFAAVFSRSPPGWAGKLAECAARHAEKASRKAPSSEGGEDGGGEGGGDGEAGGDGAGVGAGGRLSRPISIKGPKRERDETGGGGGARGGGGGGGGGLDAARKKKSRRVHV